jgi:hypothetical protein
MNSIILIAGTTGLNEPIYRLARKAKSSGTVSITSSLKKVELLIKNKTVDKVIIIHGARKFSAIDAYHRLKKINPKINFTVMDGWLWSLIRPDKMLLLPKSDMVRTIRNEL